MKPKVDDRWRRHENWLWGALSSLHPHRKILPPANPAYLNDYLDGKLDAAQGYINLPPDFDPEAFMRQRLQERDRRRAEMEDWIS